MLPLNKKAQGKNKKINLRFLKSKYLTKFFTNDIIILILRGVATYL